MSVNVTLLDKGIGDIKNEISRLVKIAMKKYPKETKKSEKIAQKIPLKIIFKRGPIVMKNNEWLKEEYRGMGEKLNLSPSTVVKVLSRKHLNWGILGYGDPKGGLKELVKFAKTKLNPAQLRGDNQDLKMDINGYNFKEENGKLTAFLYITVPDKSLGGKDIENKVLEKEGYLGINAWKQKAKSMLNKSDKLDKALLDILENKFDLTDMLEEDNKNMEDSHFEPLHTPKRVQDLKNAVRDVMLELEDTGYLDYDNGPDRVKEELEFEGIEFDPEEIDDIFEEIWFDLFHYE